MEIQQEIHRDDYIVTARIKVGTSIKIKMLDQDAIQKSDPEDYFYLKDFENKIGTISELKESRTGIISYRVDFDENHFGYFYSEDFEITTL
jgi:hypothetical protein